PFLPTSSPMTRTRSSRSISSAMAARTASIMRISPTWSSPCSLYRLGEGRGITTLLEVPYFVLGRRQERDGRSAAGTSVLPAERAARHLFRRAWQAAEAERQRPGRLLLAPAQRGRAQGREARPRRGTYGGQVPGGQG